jgi:hypothetical protein
MQHLAAPNCVARDHGDHRLGQVLDGALQVEGVEARHALLIHVAALAAHALVAAGTESLLALAGEEHHAHLRVFIGAVEGVDELKQGLGAEGIAHLGTIDRDLGDAARLLEFDVRVLTDRLPLD